MNPSPPLRIAALIVALSSTPESPGDEVGFHPAVDSTVSKEFSTTIEVALDDLVVLMNGQETDPGMLGIPADVSAEMGYVVECSDEYKAVADGRPTELLRTFQKMEGWVVGPESETRSENDDLDGTVRFLWDEDEESYERSFVDQEGDADSLLVLAEDLDLRALLPEVDVEVGESWEVAGSELMTVFAPGIDVEGALESEEADDFPEELEEALRELAEGVSATCTYRGTVDEDGEELRVIELECDLDGDFEVDPTAFVPDTGEMELQEILFEVAIELEFEGECLWDDDAGRFRSFEMEGFGSVTLDLVVNITEVEMELEGTAELAIDFARSAQAE